MAQHRATGRAQMRPLTRSVRGTHRDSATVSAGVVKAGVLTVLATATIAAPIASATASTANADPAAAASENGAEDSGLRAASGLGANLLAAGPAQAQAAPAQAAPATVAPAEVGTVSIPVAPAAQAASFGGVEAGSPSVQIAPTVETAADGEQVAAPSAAGDGYMMPVDAPITSGYGYRIHPTLGYSKMHDGVDFGAACGTPVHVAQAGTVIAVEYNSASGNRVLVDHGNGITTGYFHLSEFRTQVGATLAKGDVVGTVGSTGRSTGCHLHFAEQNSSGEYVNPMSLYGQ